MAESITLQTSDSNVQQSDVLGRLSFAASNESNTSDARLIGGSIYAMAEGDFTEIANPTSLVFATASSESATSKLKITSEGHFVPLSSGQYDLGSILYPFRNINSNIISFNVNDESALTKGQISWDDTEGTMDIGLTDNTTIHIGSHRYFRIRNETGGTLYKGQVVYASGVHANGIIKPALYVADGTVREVRFMGVILEDVNHQNNGYAIDFGHLEEMDLDGSATNYSVGDETWVAGDILYVHPTGAGKLTKNEPKHSISVAIVLDPGNGNGNGRMFVRPTSYGHLDDNHDVSVSGATNGQFLQYNSATDYWVPSSSGNFTYLTRNDAQVIISDNTGVMGADIVDNLISLTQSEYDAITPDVDTVYVITDASAIACCIDGSGIANYLAKWSDSDTLTSGIIYDNGTNVGIGTASPTEKLDVRYPVSGGVAIIKSTDSTDGVLLGDIWGANTAYQGLSHIDFSSTSSYMIMSEGTNTLISADTGGSVYLRGGPNNGSNEIRIYPANSDGIVINEQGADSNFRIEGDTDPLTFFVDAGANSIGIGTATPSAKLNVENGNVIFNDLGGNYDFRVEGDTDANLLFVDASVDDVGIGTNTPAAKLHVAGDTLFENLSYRRFTTSTDVGTHFRKYTDIAHYANSVSSITGSLRIEIPVTTSTMWSMDVVIVEYDGVNGNNIKTTNLTITGYTTTNINRGVWTNNPSRISQVRFGRNTASNRTVILIDPVSVFRYPKAYIKEINTHHSNETTFGNSANYAITITSNETDFTLNGTITNDQFIRDNKLVNTFGNQTVAGNKTFNGNFVVNEDGENFDFRVEGDTDANLLFTDASTDRVGIGTASPTAKLEVANVITGSGTLLSLHGTFWGNSEKVYLSWNRAGSYVANIGAELTGALTNANIVFETASNTERMRIASDGNVGIGTSSPSYTLDVVGTGNFSHVISSGCPAVISNTGIASGSDQILNIVSLTQAEYDAATKNSQTLYIIT